MRAPRDVLIGDRVYFTRRILAAAAALAALVGGGYAVSNAEMPSLFGETTVTQSNTVPLLLTIRNIAQYRAAEGTFQTMIERQVDAPGPSWLNGERTALYAVGTVAAQVDFAQITDDDIEVSDDRRSVTLTLPAPRLTPTQLDPIETRVVGSDRGLFQRVEDGWSDVPNDYRPLYAEAQGKLQQAASVSELRSKAEVNTRDMLTGMLGSLGFTSVTVEFDAPEPPKG